MKAKHDKLLSHVAFYCNLRHHSLGFSGTPADLLPLELGAPKFEPGTDAKVLATLTDTAVVTIRDVPGGWDVRHILRSVAGEAAAAAASTHSFEIGAVA